MYACRFSKFRKLFTIDRNSQQDNWWCLGTTSIWSFVLNRAAFSQEKLKCDIWRRLNFTGKITSRIIFLSRPDWKLIAEGCMEENRTLSETGYWFPKVINTNLTVLHKQHNCGNETTLEINTICNIFNTESGGTYVTTWVSKPYNIGIHTIPHL